MRIPNERLDQAFVALMARAGKPVERIYPRSGRVGRSDKVYRLPNGQTVRGRTNNRPAVMVKTDSGAVEARLAFEGEDFLGIAFPTGRNTVTGYLVPTKVAAKIIRARYQAWLADLSHSRECLTRVLRFVDEQPNFWSEYCLGEISLDATPVVTALDRLIAKSKREIAAEAGRPESAVTITIGY